MSKKLTVAMLKGDIDETKMGELFEGLWDTVTEKFKNKDGMMEIKSIDLKPLDIDNQEDQAVIGAFGTWVAIFAKAVCTPQAYKYLINEVKKELKEE